MFDFDQSQFEAIQLLLPVEGRIAEQGHQIPTIEARKLHEFLEVESRFNDWIANRIEQYGFQENQDFVSFTEILVKPSGGRPATSYHLTLDMAKELAMVERNEKGRQARKYFIACEKALLGAARGELSIDFIRQLLAEDRISRLAIKPDGTTTATIKRPSPSRASASKPETSAQALTDKVLAIIKRLGSPTAREIQRCIHQPIVITKEILGLLVQDGAVGSQQRTNAINRPVTRYFLRA